MSQSLRTRAESSSPNEFSSEMKAAMMYQALYSSAYKGCIDDYCAYCVHRIWPVKTLG